ncbi:ABC transporter, ATP-binding protein [Oesophagostomum dentatum]|uniref:ABC transporter, ATP-binding protein n=1 Tax=Oesophagostomum dentatum TaxID=61180 RepID=A0A0B1TDL4_OESDE|nr:ABC transporter, ATP-binding protein [Oesophagostomum dentatum]
MIPFVYAVSLFFDKKGIAKCVCIIYEVSPALLLMNHQGLKSELELYAKLFPSAEFLFAVANEVNGVKLHQRTMDLPETLFTFFVQGVFFTIVLYFCESHLKKLIRAVLKKNYVEDLTKYYGSYCALKRTTYGVKPEDCFGLVGASGAGKTSTFDIITGLRLADGGSVSMGDEFVTSTKKIGYCPQFDAMLPRLTCRQNMVIIAGIIGFGGQKRRVSIGTALLNPSKLVILDEPTAGLDPEARHHIWSLLKFVRSGGRALLLSSHSMEECEALCSRIGVLVKGRLVAIGASQALKSR